MLVKEALKYLSLGLSVIPVRNKSTHLIKWKEYSQRRATPDEVKEWWEKWPDANIAICTGSVSKLVVVDIDSDEGAKIMRGILSGVKKLPVVNTPRGGKHLWFFSEDSMLRNNVNEKIQCDFRANGGIVLAPPSMNGNGKRYEWSKGQSIFEVESPELPEAYLEYLKKCIPLFNTKTNTNSMSLYRPTNENLQKPTETDNFLQTGSRDNDLFNVANCLVKGGMPEERIFQVVERLAKTCSPEFPEGEAIKKVQSAIERNARGGSSVAHQVRTYVDRQDGDIKLTTMYIDLQLPTNSRDAAWREIKRLKDKKIIEPMKGVGMYRKIDKSFESIKEFSVEGQNIVDLKFPLDLEYYAKIFPGNIIIVSGQKSAGKTGFCLSFATMNRDRRDLRYISSEFGGDELKERLDPMDLDPNEWIDKIDFALFRGDPQDAIDPNGVNIVDYLEIKDGEFFKIGSQIDAIFDKLDKGVALIALQMNPGQDYARGGSMTLDKSRLYVTLRSEKTKGGIVNMARMVDVKNRVDKETNPNGWECQYRLGGGHFFKRMDSWMPR